VAGLTEQAVRDRLRSLCPPDAEPRLEPNDLDTMVAAARQADIDGNPPDSYQPWQAGVSLAVGALAVPTDRNGWAYRVSVAAGQGLAGAVEPIWPLSGTVVDNQLTWELWDAAPWTPTWSPNAGAAEGWRIKAAKAAERYSFSAGTDRFDINQVLDHCLRMVKLYEGSGVATLVNRDRRDDALRWASVLP
jgi:hypothetical protein